MIKLWCEWDFGQDEYIFDTTQNAFMWLQRTISLETLKELALDSHQQLFDEGLAGYKLLRFWEPE